jgi:FkbM family methyltransferase
MAQLLRRSVALNGFRRTVKVHPVALAAASGVPAGFVAPEAEPENGRLLQDDGVADGRPDGAAPVVEVPVRSLDDAIRGQVDFIRIDVGGAEEMIWQGMQCVIDNNPRVRIAMKFNPARCRTPEDTLAEMAARFRLRRIGLDGRVQDCLAEEVLQRRGKSLLYLSAIDPE